MMTVTFQVLEGVDKGRIFRELAPPLTIGREEGNSLRLNDERVSRFHAKVQEDNADIILTDLESTNGTRVNGNVVQIRRLRLGDRICVGRSMLLFGSSDEIAARMAAMAGIPDSPGDDGGSESPFLSEGPSTIRATFSALPFEQDMNFDLDAKAPISITGGNLFSGNRPLPPLPQKLTPGQAARIAEILEFLHRGLTVATENMGANEEGTAITLPYPEWQKVLVVQMVLARYIRAVTEPDSLHE